MSKPLISLKIVGKNDAKVRMFVTRKTKRIYSFLKADKAKDCLYILSVRYENGVKNEGAYKSLEDLVVSLKAFLEK